MSALAAILHKQGHTVSGSDQQRSATTDHLKKIGVKIFIGHYAHNIPKQTQYVVHSLAIPKSNPELREARRRKVETYAYPQTVGHLSRFYYTIAICGTHGKTTTTAMVAKILIENGFDPTVIVGSKLDFLDGQNYRVGKSKFLVLEACEYQKAFLNYFPNAIVVLNIEPDHFDAFKNEREYHKVFDDFIARLPDDGILIQPQKPSALPFKLKVPGKHNMANAAAAMKVCETLGVPRTKIKKSLQSFQGSARRFEIKGKIGRTIVIDDFAHHPTEIRATLQAAREKYPKKKICVIFQPHQYSRTKALLKEFGPAFKGAALVVIPNIYEARDTAKDKRSVSSGALVQELKKNKINAIDGKGMEPTLAYVKTHHKNCDLIITMGAGDVSSIAQKLIG